MRPCYRRRLDSLFQRYDQDGRKMGSNGPFRINYLLFKLFDLLRLLPFKFDLDNARMWLHDDKVRLCIFYFNLIHCVIYVGYMDLSFIHTVLISEERIRLGRFSIQLAFAMVDTAMMIAAYILFVKNREVTAITFNTVASLLGNSFSLFPTLSFILCDCL